MESMLPKPSSLLKSSGLVRPGTIASKFTSSKIGTIGTLKPARSMISLNQIEPAQTTQILPLTRDPMNLPRQQPPPSVASRVAGRAAMRRSKSCADFKKPLRPDLRSAADTIVKKPLVPITASSFKRPLPSKRPLVQTASFDHTAPKVTKTVPKTAKIPPYDYKARFNDLLEKHKVLKAEHIKFKELEPEHQRMTAELMTISRELEITKNELKTSKQKIAIEEKEKQELQHKLEKSNQQVVSLTSDIDDLKKSFDAISEANSTLNKDLCYFKELSDKKTNEVVELTIKAEEQNTLIYNANIERKRLHNDIQDLKGNIRVYCRVRPAIGQETNKILSNMIFTDENSLKISKSETSNKSSVAGKVRPSNLDFTFDQVFSPVTSQDELFLSVSPLVQSALDGYNVCIFAYGQTGSGKTYTMEGDNSSGKEGVIPRTVQLIFDSINTLKAYGWNYKVSASFLEIYNEHIYDLLDPNKDQPEHEIKITDSKGTDVYVTNLREDNILESAQLINLLEQAQRNRATAATENNERSSRSHSVAKINLIGVHQETKEILKGSINLVDLAGSESPKNSLRMEETKNINKSLAELGKVILSLQQKQDHIPYRNSRLTFLLMPCLGGNSKTLMFVNLNPLDDCYNETVSSLRFAQRVNQVKNSKLKRNRVREVSDLSQSNNSNYF